MFSFAFRFYKYLKNNPFTDSVRAEEFLEWMHRFDNSIQCSDTWFDVSARGITEYKSCDGDLLLNWKDRGYKTVFDLLMVSRDVFFFLIAYEVGKEKKVLFQKYWCGLLTPMVFAVRLLFFFNDSSFQRSFPNRQRALPVMDKIIFGKEVSSIDNSLGKDVVVKTIDGHRYLATHVIFTASLGVLKEQHSTLFTSPLPEKKKLSIEARQNNCSDR